MSLSKKVAIVGVDESDEIGICKGKTSIVLHAEAARNALRDAGLELRDVDGLFTAGPSVMFLAEYLGIQPKYMDSTTVGGSSFVIEVEHAAAAIEAGICNVALITHGEMGYSARRGRASRGAGPARFQDPEAPSAQFEYIYGLGPAPSVYAMAAMRHMHEFGTTHEQLAEIAVATRKWAQLNPKAFMREPLTIDDVLSSRWIAYPFHIYDCCLVTDAGGACVVVGADRARDLPKKPAWLLGSGEATTHQTLLNNPDLTQTPARYSGERAFKMAGLTHKDIDVVEVYDSFTYTALVTIEELGFCAKGEGGPFLSEQRSAPGGDFPMNTNGGGLSYTHPGMYGMFLIIEAVRQLRGECGERQVPDANTALVNGTGGSLSSTGTLILGVD
ncbi:MAG: acetyl-CoA acetyltransferase [Dehalococcoidia bacterium]|nr:acetyl-CoA acetyltransferase [Dehalococcoidia bacterium]